MICLLTQMAPLEVLIPIWTHPARTVAKLRLSGVASAMDHLYVRCVLRPLREDRALKLRSIIVDYRNIIGDAMLWPLIGGFPATEVNELAFAQKQLLHIRLQLVLRQHRCRSRTPQLCTQSWINENAEASFEFRQVHFGAFNVV